MSRRGRRDVEEGNVREGHSWAEKFGIWRFWVWVRGLRRPVLEQVKDGLRNGRSGISARAGHRRNGDLGLWVRNKEQWADRRVMTADTRVLGLRRVSRSRGIRKGSIS